jgi:hypothetical protein
VLLLLQLKFMEMQEQQKAMQYDRQHPGGWLLSDITSYHVMITCRCRGDGTYLQTLQIHKQHCCNWLNSFEKSALSFSGCCATATRRDAITV